MRTLLWLTGFGLFSLLTLGLFSNFVLKPANTLLATVLINGENHMSYRQHIIPAKGTNLQQRIGEYFDAQGKLAVRSEAIYNPSTATLYSYKMEDIRTKYSESIQLNNNQYTLSKKVVGTTQAEEKTISAKGIQLHGSIIDLILSKSLPQLQQGKTITFDLMLPIHLRTVEFRLQKRDDETIDGVTYEVVSMEPSNFIIRRMVEPGYFYISKVKPHAVVMYKGRLIPADEQGKGISGTMVYSRPGS
jgi:hypothetical protein